MQMGFNSAFKVLTYFSKLKVSPATENIRYLSTDLEKVSHSFPSFTLKRCFPLIVDLSLSLVLLLLVTIILNRYAY
jgi:hypothetical protein